jgi:hypothetical protein
LVILSLLIAGCGDRHKSKEELLNKGVQLMAVHNPNGAIIVFKKALEKDPNSSKPVYSSPRPISRWASSIPRKRSSKRLRDRPLLQGQSV